MRGELVVDLLRHGQLPGGDRFRGSVDDPLTGLGWRNLWRAVDGGEWDAIVTSPMQRCRIFSASLAVRHGLPWQIVEDLREISFGAWEGLTAEEVRRTAPEELGRFWDNPLSFTPPEGEPLPMFSARVLAAWRDILEQAAGERLLVVAHGGTLRMILAEVLGFPLQVCLKSMEWPYGGMSRLRMAKNASGIWQGSLVFHDGHP